MKIAIFLFATTLLLIEANAQRPVDIQQTNVKAPEVVRVDGKLQEWGNPLIAENKRTDLAYTLANDEFNIYLAIKSSSATSITKIMAGGITVSINAKGRRKEEDASVITYPFIARNSIRNTGAQNRSRTQNNSERSQIQRDSLTLAQRKTELAGVKEIKVSGFEAIQDSLISIYNEYGIKAKSIIDEHGAYSYELAIPLKQLGIDAKSTKEIAYQIKVNGRQLAQNATMGRNGGGSFGANVGGANRSGFGGGGGMAQQDLNNPTHFWGRYPLQK
jgi:hypothetical protein